MKQKEQTKTIMTILNCKNPFGLHGLSKNILSVVRQGNADMLMIKPYSVGHF